MRNYLELIRHCVDFGVRQKNRTGIDTYMIPGAMLQFNLQHGFPILTTKTVNFGAVAAELVGFIRGVDSAAAFRDLGTTIWDANANKNPQWLANPNRKGKDDLGRIYGKQWREWRYPAPGSFETVVEEVDQLAVALHSIKNDPTSRRIIVSAWQPAELDQMALPPCHLLYQFLVGQAEHRLHMTMFMRSCDMFLGIPFNISSYALLLSLVAQATGYTAGTLTMFLSDVHIYENHKEQVATQLDREPRLLPALTSPVTPGAGPEKPLEWLEAIIPTDVGLAGYDPHPPIRAEMAV